MLKYTRKDINVKAQLHGKQFVTVDDVHEVLMTLADLAVKAGADEVKLMEFFSEKD